MPVKIWYLQKIQEQIFKTCEMDESRKETILQRTFAWEILSDGRILKRSFIMNVTCVLELLDIENRNLKNFHCAKFHGKNKS